MSKILVFAGPNGSGKTTITYNIKCVGQYINADIIKKDINCSDLEAAQIADKTRQSLLNRKMDFTFETVLSTQSKIDFLKHAKSEGYHISCYYILTVNPRINIQRVRERVKKGGHDVPEEKIISRYIRAISLLPQLFSICDEIYIFDNSSDKGESDRLLVVEGVYGNVSLFPNKYWSIDALNKLISGNYHPE